MDDTFINSNNIYKSYSDKKEYRLITLENGIRAILVSDVENLVNLEEMDVDTELVDDDDDDDDNVDGDDGSEGDDQPKGEKMAGCAVSVNVGSFSDPPDIPGLAHFVEHMLFMGSEEYPEESALDEFLVTRGGSDNGTTDCEYTTLLIETRENHLKKALHMFAQCFIAPLMLREAMTREREAIDAEFELALPSDGSRAEQLLGSLAPVDHPARCFTWGNLVSLRDNISDDKLYSAAHDFRRRYYSAQHMSIAVVARLSLDTLEEMVRENFSAVPNNGLPAPDFSRFKGQFGRGDSFHSMIWMKPVHELREVTLSWILPSVLQSYEGLPLCYLGLIMGNEGKGSLISYLRKKLWCLDVSAGNDGTGFEYNSMFSSYSITLELTELGLENLTEVLNAAFEYIAMTRKRLPDKRCYDEMKDILAAKFKYKYEEDAPGYAEKLSVSLHQTKPEHILLNQEVFLEYQPDVIKNILDEIKAQNVNIMISTQSKPDDFFNAEEPWFKTKYRREEIPTEWINTWENASPPPYFFLPLPNPYVAKKFTLLDSNVVNHPEYPQKILNNDIMEVWYRQDLKFKLPFAMFNVHFKSATAKWSAQSALLLRLLTKFLTQKLKEEFYPASEAGYIWVCRQADLGFIFSFSGYDEKITLFYEEVLKSVRSVCQSLGESSNEGLFEALKAEYNQELLNNFKKSDDLNKFIRLSLLLDVFWTPMEMLTELEGLTLKDLDSFCQTLFTALHVKMLIQGNITEEAALDAATRLTVIFPISPLNENFTMAIWKLPSNKEIYIRAPSFSTTDSNAVVTNYYQVGPYNGSLRKSCIIELVMLLLSVPLFDELRTNQQLGYDVGAELRDSFGILGFSVTVHYQSTKFTAEHVDERIETFLNEFSKTLRDMPEELIERTKEATVATKRVVDLKLTDECLRNFAEITTGEYIFDRLLKEAEIVPTITKDEMCDWFDTHVKGSKDYRKLSVQVHGSLANTDCKDCTEDCGIKLICPDENKFIQKMSTFKLAREMYPPQQTS